MKITLALAQFETLLHQPELNIAKAENFIRESVRQKADIVAFPEEFLTGTLRIRLDLVDGANRYLQVFRGLAKKYNVDIQTGTWYVKQNGKLRNAAYYIDHKGNVLGEYFKNHLWHTEKVYSTPGTESCVVKSRFGKIGMAICWDLIYPETFRGTFQKGAELVIVPALWSFEDAGAGIKIDPQAEVKLVNAVVTTRAFENQTAIAFVNGAGRFKVNGSLGRLIGRTQVAVPFKGCLNRCNHTQEELLITKLDTDSLLKTAEESYKIREDYAKKKYWVKK